MAKKKEARCADTRQSLQRNEQTNDGMTSRHYAQDNRSEAPASSGRTGQRHSEVDAAKARYTREQLHHARLTLSRADRWWDENPDARNRMVAQALELAALKQPIAVQSLFESMRKKAFVDRYGNDTRVNNSFAPIFARRIIREYPETKPYIELRSSVFDILLGGDNE